MKGKSPLPILTEGCTQAEEYNLSNFAVFAASNSGQTKEVISLTTALKSRIIRLYSDSPPIKIPNLRRLHQTPYIDCGKEDAVAATKSVIEQGLFYDSLLRNISGEKMEGLKELAEKTEQALT